MDSSIELTGARPSPRLMICRPLVGRNLLALPFLGLLIVVTACKEPTKEPAKAKSAVTTEPAKSPVALPAEATPVQRSLFGKDPECYRCGAAQCADSIRQLDTIAGVASEGPAKGKPKVELGQATLTCVLAKRCVVNNASVKCYCGDATGEDCIGNAANGPCKSVIESGLETTDPPTIARNYGKPDTGAGAALSLVLCLTDNGCKTCF